MYISMHTYKTSLRLIRSFQVNQPYTFDYISEIQGWTRHGTATARHGRVRAQWKHQPPGSLFCLHAHTASHRTHRTATEPNPISREQDLQTPIQVYIY